MLLLTAVIAMQGTLSIASLDLSHAQQGWGSPRANLSVDGNPITIAGQVFEGSFGTHADSMLAVQLDGKATRFRAYVGVDDEVAEGRGSVEFKVTGDGKSLWQSGVMKRGDAAKAVDVSLRGVQKMVLVVTGGGDGIDYDHADWADAVIELAAGSRRTSRRRRWRPGRICLLPSGTWGRSRRFMGRG